MRVTRSQDSEPSENPAGKKPPKGSRVPATQSRSTGMGRATRRRTGVRAAGPAEGAGGRRRALPPLGAAPKSLGARREAAERGAGRDDGIA